MRLLNQSPSKGTTGTCLRTRSLPISGAWGRGLTGRRDRITYSPWRVILAGEVGLSSGIPGTRVHHDVEGDECPDVELHLNSSICPGLSIMPDANGVNGRPCETPSF